MEAVLRVASFPASEGLARLAGEVLRLALASEAVPLGALPVLGLRLQGSGEAATPLVLLRLRWLLPWLASSGGEGVLAWVRVGFVVPVL